MAVMGLLFPAVLHATHTELEYGASELSLSRFSSIIMLAAYSSFIYFQLRSDKEHSNDADEEVCIFYNPDQSFVL
jgi:Ca2+:H+ antiporter